MGLAGKNRGEMIAGILHDVVEDTEFTFDDLLEKGNPIAVKWSDLTHNQTRDSVCLKLLYVHLLGRDLTVGSSGALDIDATLGGMV